MSAAAMTEQKDGTPMEIDSLDQTEVKVENTEKKVEEVVRPLTLISVDGKSFKTTNKICRLSGLITTASANDQETEIVPLYSMTRLNPNDETDEKTATRLADADPNVDGEFLVTLTDSTGKSQYVKSGVNSKYVQMALDFMAHYDESAEPWKEIERPLKSPKMAECVPQWDADFVNVDVNTYMELIRAANYLDLQPMLFLACAKAASDVHGKTTQQIRDHWKIENDFTPEEEAKMIEENSWADNM